MNYVLDMQKRISSKKSLPKWVDDEFILRFSNHCYEKAPLCACGCGNKTLPVSDKNGNHLEKHMYKFKKGEDVLFFDRVKDHNTPFNLSEPIKQAIMASLLGDGYMNYPNKQSKMPRMAWNMGNYEHALYKTNFFSDYGAKMDEAENPGWGTKWYRIKTSCSIAFVDMYKSFRIDDKVERANIIAPMLNEIGWAWYYGDDGHYRRESGIAYIHTEGLLEEGSWHVCNALNDFLGGDHATVDSYMGGNPKKQRFMVRLRKEGTRIFFSKIKEHMATGLEYKVE